MLKHYLAPLAAVVVISAFIVPCNAAEAVAAGTGMEIRLLVSSGSRTSHVGDPVQGMVISPVLSEGRLVIPAGTLISGKIDSVERLGLGLKHSTAALGYHFDALRWPDGEISPIDAQVVEVENGKEQVSANGVIRGIHPTASLSSSFTFYGLPILCMEPHIALSALSVKFVIARSPDPEIYFPAGTEFFVKLTAPANIEPSGASSIRLACLSAQDLSEAHEILEKLPQQRTKCGRHRPSDLVNLIFLGNRASIDRAFHAAGWSGSQGFSPISVYRLYRCLVQRNSYTTAPMARLTLNGLRADAEYQKSLNTFSKRHHLRLWQQGGSDLWLSAATEDIRYQFHKMHPTHATDPAIDNERNKAINDLALTGCLNAGAMIPRRLGDLVESSERSITTDGKIAVVRFNDCQHPRSILSESDASGPRARPRILQILVALRNDILRSNPISLAINTVEQIKDSEGRQVGESKLLSGSRRMRALPSQNRALGHWARASVLN